MYWSLSARRAWIEMGVLCLLCVLLLSLSARRAWIEILIWLAKFVCFACVALRKESVDRNGRESGFRVRLYGRSPQGERG